MPETKIRRILIAVRPWQQQLPLSHAHARFLAEKLGADIELLSCISESQLSYGLAWTEPGASTTLQKDGFETEQERLEKLAQPLRDAGSNVTTRVSSHVPAYQGILDEVQSWQADLLIVGVHEPRPVPHTRLTDIDWQLMRLCPCPLLLVRDPDAESYRSILAAVDPLHRHAEPAGLDQAVLQTAATLGGAFDAALTVVNAYPNPDEYEFASSVEVVPGVFYGTENIAAAHRKAVADLIDAYGISTSQAIVEPGEPGTVIADVTHEHRIDLVVLGAIKRSRLQAAVLGSTAEAVVGAAACDVLLVKPPA
jgi:universal stress protein E